MVRRGVVVRVDGTFVYVSLPRAGGAQFSQLAETCVPGLSVDDRVVVAQCDDGSLVVIGKVI